MSEEQKNRNLDDEDEESTEANATLHTILTALEELRSTDTPALGIPAIAERWNASMKSGQDAFYALKKMMDEWENEFEFHYYRAQDTLDAIDMLDGEEDSDLVE
jgi:hypothetical protein